MQINNVCNEIVGGQPLVLESEQTSIKENLCILDVSMVGFEKGVPRVYENIMSCITSRIYKDPPLVLGKENYMYKYKIRKITPLEAWRLMCFKDEDYLATKVGSREKATELIDKYNGDSYKIHEEILSHKKELENMSNTQLYKQAGNSICRNVLMAIFSQMNIKGVPRWNDLNEDERYNLILKDTCLSNREEIN